MKGAITSAKSPATETRLASAVSTERSEHMSHLGSANVALAFTVERLEGLVEVRERARVLLLQNALVDGQELLELVLPLTELLRTAVLVDELQSRVQVQTTDHIAHLGCLHHTVATVPEVEQVEHLTGVYTNTPSIY